MKKLALLTVLALFSNLAHAHPGHGLGSAFAGFMHPLTGIDHLLVMLAIGFWAAKLGGQARWQLPLTFVLVMALGAGLGASGVYFAGVETAIAASVMAMGVLLLLSLPIPRIAQFALTAVFALFHGMAHGLELNVSSAALAGMLLATALLHGVGYLLGAQRLHLTKWLNSGFAALMLLVGGYLLMTA